MPDIKSLAKEVWPFVVEMRRDFHRHPEPSYHEFRTTDRHIPACRERLL